MINFIQSYRDDAVYLEQLYALQTQVGQAGQLESAPSENEIVSTPEEIQQVREITLSELSESDGSNGKPAYVAVNGNVYDVTKVIRWAGGTHFGLYAGKNLTSEFMSCHRGSLENLNKLPLIGILKE